MSYFDKLSFFAKEMIIRYHRAFNLFLKRKATILAASSSFYVILTAAPLTLLSVQILGFLIGDIQKINYVTILLGKELFPELSVDILMRVQNFIANYLFAEARLTILNTIILLLTSLSLFNAIYYGIYLIKEEVIKINCWLYFKGFLLIVVTIGLLLGVLSIQSLIIFMAKLLQKSTLVEFIWHNVEFLREYIDFLKNISLDERFIFRSRLLFFLFFIFYFTLIFRWFLNWKLKFTYAMVSSLTFMLLLTIARKLFWVYFSHARSILIENYGTYYIFIATLIWIFLVMCFFFYSICLSITFMEYSSKGEGNTLVTLGEGGS